MSAHASQTAEVDRRVFDTRDEDEITDFLRTTYIGNETTFGAVHGQPRWRAATTSTPYLTGDHIRSSIDYRGVADPFDYYLFYLCRRGRLEVDHVDGQQRIGVGDATFYATGQPLTFDFRHMGIDVLRLPPGRLEQLAQDLTGAPAAGVRFHSGTPVSEHLRGRWVETFGFISTSLHGLDGTPGSLLMAHEMARLLVAAALETFPNTTMGRHLTAGPGTVATAAIRRAAAYVDAHAHQPLDLADIAAAAGTSTRALQYGFRRHLETTPIGYLRRVRLEHAHRDLQAADPTRGDTVVAIATRWGFCNPGRFSVLYREQYGVLPSQTLRC